jgi:hypothetical protein
VLWPYPPQCDLAISGCGGWLEAVGNKGRTVEEVSDRCPRTCLLRGFGEDLMPAIEMPRVDPKRALPQAEPLDLSKCQRAQRCFR